MPTRFALGRLWSSHSSISCSVLMSVPNSVFTVSAQIKKNLKSERQTFTLTFFQLLHVDKLYGLEWVSILNFPSNAVHVITFLSPILLEWNVHLWFFHWHPFSPWNVPLTSHTCSFSHLFLEEMKHQGSSKDVTCSPLTFLTFPFHLHLAERSQPLAVPFMFLTFPFLTFIWWNGNNPGCSIDVPDFLFLTVPRRLFIPALQ